MVVTNNGGSGSCTPSTLGENCTLQTKEHQMLFSLIMSHLYSRSYDERYCQVNCESFARRSLRHTSLMRTSISLTNFIVSRPRSTAMSRKCWTMRGVVIRPLPTRQYRSWGKCRSLSGTALDTKTPEVADKCFRRAFEPGKLGVINEFNSQSSFDY